MGPVGGTGCCCGAGLRWEVGLRCGAFGRRDRARCPDPGGRFPDRPIQFPARLQKLPVRMCRELARKGQVMKRDDLTNRETTGLEVLEVGRVPVKAWTRGVPVEDQAREQLRNVASLPFVFKHVAVMPDVHWGMGATVGSVIATKGAIVPGLSAWISAVEWWLPGCHSPPRTYPTILRLAPTRQSCRGPFGDRGSGSAWSN
jgi:hypothetical protein